MGYAVANEEIIIPISFAERWTKMHEKAEQL